MRDYLHTFLTENEWPQAATSAILDFYDQFQKQEDCRGALQKWQDAYARDRFLDYRAANQEIASLAREAGLGEYEALLLLYLCFSKELWEHYIREGLPLETCRRSLEDLKWKALECHTVYGVWGSFVADWFPGFFQLKRFTLGRLQYEEIPFPEDYPLEGELRKRKVDVVLNMHIPSAGPLTYESCLASYEEAAAFWRKYFHREAPAFLCSSWLLYPAHEQILPPRSNILRFQRDFACYEVWEDPAGGDLWRIFGCEYDGHPEHLPEDTALRKAYKRYLCEGNLPGGAAGFLKKTEEDR